MAITFPIPTFIGQQFSAAGKTWEWNGVAWDSVTVVVVGATGATGAQGATGLGATGATGIQGPTPWTLPATVYDNGVAYNIGAAVTYLGGYYYRSGNPLNPGYPPEPGIINASWTPVADGGATGLNGATGLDGATGITGDIGATGITGDTGATGIQGEAGATGITGDTGATGVNGIDGATGATGDIGATGLDGATGATGLQGDIGATGATGPSVAWDFLGSWENNLLSNLQAFYKLSNTSDSSGNNRTLTNNNNVTFAPGKIGDAAVLDGSNCLTNETFAFPAPLNGFTVSGWVKVNSSEQDGSYKGLITKWAGPSRGEFIIGINGIDINNYFFGFRHSNGESAPVQFPIVYDTWELLTFAVDYQTMVSRVYKNGSLVEQNSFDGDGNFDSSDTFLAIGASESSTNYNPNAQIDAVGIWNRALSNAEVFQLYSNGNGLELEAPAIDLKSDLQAFYKLSDTSDSSWNNHTLTNNNNVTFAPGKIGDAAVFDGSNNLKSSFIVPYSTSDVTLSLWLKAPATSQWRTFFGSLFNTGVPRINYGINDADQIFINDAGNGGPLLTLSNYTVDDTWQHIVAVITNSGDSVKFYRAGNLVDELTGAALGSTEVWIGGGVGYPVEADLYNGSIDAVGIWNRALNEVEVTALYNNGDGLELTSQIYNVGDVVTYQGQTWYCIQNAPSGYGPFYPYIDVYWTLLAQMGATGLAGSTGVTGATGDTGATGLTGATGDVGATGLEGSTGATGVSGTDGATGATGPAGDVGATGLEGATGLTGATGPATGTAGGDLSGNYPDPTVVALQGNAVSSSYPSSGQTLQWNGSAWVPGAIPNGGSGGGGLVYFLNYQNTTGISPTTGLPTSPVAVSQLGRNYSVGSGSITSENLTEGSYSLVCGFVTPAADPGVTDIPAGLWDFNIWCDILGGNGSANQTQFQIRIYKYTSSTSTYTSLANSDDVYVYDPTTIAQYIANVTIPQTTILATDRIYVELWAQKNVNQSRQIRFYFDSLHPSHGHTTLPSVAGNGVVKVVNGVFESPASAIVNADVSATAAIVISKLSQATSKILGRTTSGTGSVEELSVAGNLTLASGTLTSTSTNFQIFTSSGTWTKPANAKSVNIQLFGAGGGGGAGRKDTTTGTVRCGGGGGGGGGYLNINVPAASLSATESVTIGAGGTGGVGVTTNLNGGSGVAGGATIFNGITCLGGNGGGAGTTTSGAAGQGLLQANPGGAASTTGLTGGTGLPLGVAGISEYGGVGGGAGGGISTADAASAGGTGGRSNVGSLVGGTAGTAGNAGGAGNSNSTNIFYAGSGGAGGGGGTTVSGGAGGAGGFPAGGGGGGGATISGTTSGSGGVGGSGWAIITTYF